MDSHPERIKHYRIGAQIGRGGMGVVYAAHDERLDRSVAIKMILGATADPVARQRFWREARAAAAVNHPQICQLYEIDEIDGQLYLVMELLEGESLADRLARGAVPLSEAIPLTVSILEALEALHDNQVVHRDLKPSNVFLTKFGVKLLDFGLARSLVSDELATGADLTVPGKVIGTPAYMAPEQLSGRPVDARADLFATGAILYEMLAGKAAFGNRQTVDVMHAVLHSQPPALGGSPAIESVDAIIGRSLEKAPSARYHTAGEMADALRAIMTASDGLGPPVVARAVTRLIVLPLRVLRPDPDTDFLAFGLADAITNSLAGIESLVVRSSLAATAYGSRGPDLKQIAEETGVDAVLTGAIMRAGDQIRVSAQLLEAPGGTVLWSGSVQSPLGDLFSLQDDFSRRIVESLSIPLTRREMQRLGRDVPATARAYELYLRGNECTRERSTWRVAYELFAQCVDEDPRFAPGWARLGRMERLIGIHFEPDLADEHLRKAERAFERALGLNPDLALAHNLYAYVEVDLGRAKKAMLRLLRSANTHHADPDLYAGLVHVCRYCGLLEASIAAYEKAHRLDPNVETSVCHSFWFAGDAERAVATDTGETPFMTYLLQIRRGQHREVIDVLRQAETAHQSTYAAGWSRLIAALTGDRESFERGLDDELSLLRDPEGIYYWALMAAVVGDTDRVFTMLERTVERGWMCFQAMTGEPVLTTLRSDPRMNRIVRGMQERHQEARAAFIEAGGERLLGVTV